MDYLGSPIRTGRHPHPSVTGRHFPESTRDQATVKCQHGYDTRMPYPSGEEALGHELAEALW
jgi:hypothetical protein